MNTECIDIVYLWVDGADPLWQAQRLEAQKLHNGIMLHHPAARYGDVGGRYRDNGELRFNLRALERFFPAHGHIYIITDGQTPAWLQVKEGLTLIHHRELMLASALPVFDSGHIESYLHHIPNLSERFFYLNDDTFFGAPVDINLWFSDSGVAVFTDDPTLTDHKELRESKLVCDWWAARYPIGKYRDRVFAHSPRAFFKSMLYDIENAAPELFADVRSTVFRSGKVPSLVADFIPLWMLETNQALVRNVESMHISSSNANVERNFQNLANNFGNLVFFCVNDTSDNAHSTAPELQMISHYLEKMLPTPSYFEKT